MTTHKQQNTMRLVTAPTHELTTEATLQWQQIRENPSPQNVESFEPLFSAIISRVTGLAEAVGATKQTNGEEAKQPLSYR